MKFLIATLLGITTLISCSNSTFTKKNISFSIENKTSLDIEGNVYTYTTGSTILDSLSFSVSAGELEIVNWKKPELGNSDGAYTIKTDSLEQNFGYISGGSSTNKEFQIKIYNDSIVID